MACLKCRIRKWRTVFEYLSASSSSSSSSTVFFCYRRLTDQSSTSICLKPLFNILVIVQFYHFLCHQFTSTWVFPRFLASILLSNQVSGQSPLDHQSTWRSTVLQYPYRNVVVSLLSPMSYSVFVADFQHSIVAPLPKYINSSN